MSKERSMRDEIWKAVVGYEGFYEVSDFGRVRSIDRVIQKRHGHAAATKGCMLRAKIGKHGHRTVTLQRLGSRTFKQVHRLVLEAFVGPCPDGMEACHADGNASNNRVENLRWDTHAANMADRIRHGNNPFASRTHCKRGHSLDGPNLVKAASRRGQRGCLACNREGGRARRDGRQISQDRADAEYRSILSAAGLLPDGTRQESTDPEF